MGCTCSRRDTIIIANKPRDRTISNSNTHPQPNKFTLNIIKDQDNFSIQIEHNNEYLLLTDLVNIACFNSKYADMLDANFICLNKNDHFEYFIDRLVGLERNEVEPKGEWFVYLNATKYSWNYLISNNRIVHKLDNLELKFERGYVM